MPATKSIWPRAILHVDMDAFFVNVHLLDHPADRGIPLAVGGNPHGRGVVASASYEARQYGVRSAMPSGQALKLCPSLKFVRHDWSRIKASSRLVMDLLSQYGPLEQMSVDEAYIDISDLATQDQPERIALLIREQVRRETKLPASVGLATSKLVAKVASDFDKPEGCTIVSPGEEAAFLAPLPVRALHGIGPRTAEKLTLLHIETCAHLASTPLLDLTRLFGKQAESLQQRAQGIDPRPVESERGQAKSISQERTFSDDVTDADFLLDKLGELVDIVAQGLQRRGLVAHTVFVKFRWADFTTFTRQKSVETGIDQPADILRLAAGIFLEYWPEGQAMRLLGVGTSNLEAPHGRQLTLFGKL